MLQEVHDEAQTLNPDLVHLEFGGVPRVNFFWIVVLDTKMEARLLLPVVIEN